MDARIILLGVGLLLAGSQWVVAAELRVGASGVNINPPVGTPLAGYYRERACEGVLDDLLAKAVVFDDGQTRAAMVVCDLLTLPRKTVLEARRQIAEATGIPADHVLIAATHSHTGPVLARDSALDGVVGATKTLCREYVDQLPKLIAQAVIEAQAKAAPSRVFAARQAEADLAFNRRYWMTDGTVGWNPGKLNAKVMRPAGPIDPEVGVVYFEALDKKPQLTFVNYAMHPDTTGGARVSADYPGALSRRLADYKGPDMLTLFANGACGNINHVNPNWASPQSGPQEANRLGTMLAAAVFKAYTKLAPVADLRLQVRRETVRLPLPPLTDEHLVQARKIAARGDQARFTERVEAYKYLDVEARKGEAWEVEVQVIALGKDLAWVSMPGELFVEPGLNIKSESPFRQTHIVELANGSIGYIPNRSAYLEGNYEVLSARCAPGSAELLTSAATRMLAEMAK